MRFEFLRSTVRCGASVGAFVLDVVLRTLSLLELGIRRPACPIGLEVAVANRREGPSNVREIEGVRSQRVAWLLELTG